MAHRRVELGTLLLVAASTLLASSCGSDDDPGSPDGSVGAETDAPVCVAPGDSFSVGVAKTSTSGLTVSIEDANPAPPGIGHNAWRIKITDRAGNPVVGATVNFALYMPPPHGHDMPGTTGNDTGNGVYSSGDLNFLMPGLVDITVQVAVPGGQPDKVLFEFCVQRKGN